MFRLMRVCIWKQHVSVCLKCLVIFFSACSPQWSMWSCCVIFVLFAQCPAPLLAVHMLCGRLFPLRMGSCFSRAVGQTLVLASMSREQLPQIHHILTKVFSNYAHLMCHPGMPSVPTSVFWSIRNRIQMCVTGKSAVKLCFSFCLKYTLGRFVWAARNFAINSSLLFSSYFSIRSATCEDFELRMHIERVLKRTLMHSAWSKVKSTDSHKPRFDPTLSENVSRLNNSKVMFHADTQQINRTWPWTLFSTIKHLL